VTLALPDVSLQEQKAYFKQLKAEGGLIQLDGRPVKLEEAHLFVSGNGKRIKFKEPVVEANETSGEFVGNLDNLAEAVGLGRAKLDELRKVDGFPVREKDGYSVAATREFCAEQVEAAEE